VRCRHKTETDARCRALRLRHHQSTLSARWRRTSGCVIGLMSLHCSITLIFYSKSKKVK